jgi:hypothetical protein
MKTHQLKIGDTLKPLNSILYYGDDPYDIAALSVKFQMEGEDNGTSKVAESTTGVTIHPTQTFTLDSTNNWIKCDAHGFKVGQTWVPATSGSLSGTGLTAATRYRIVETDQDWFRVSLRSGGAAVTIAAAGSGTHSGFIVGSVQKAFLAADVNAVGRYSAWWTVYSGSDRATAPTNGQITVEILPFGN